jgi:hypothetical protein
MISLMNPDFHILATTLIDHHASMAMLILITAGAKLRTDLKFSIGRITSHRPLNCLFWGRVFFFTFQYNLGTFCRGELKLV